MIPPGLAYLCVSERAWQRMETAKQPRYYFDLRKGAQVTDEGRIGLHPGSGADLRTVGGARLHSQGRQWQSCRWTGCAHPQRGNLPPRWFGAGVQALGLELFAPTCPAAAVTAILAPKGVGFQCDRQGVPRNASPWWSPMARAK